MGKSPYAVTVPARNPGRHRSRRASVGVEPHQGRALRVAWRPAWTRPHASNSAAPALQRDELLQMAELGFGEVAGIRVDDLGQLGEHAVRRVAQHWVRAAFVVEQAQRLGAVSGVKLPGARGLQVHGMERVVRSM